MYDLDRKPNVASMFDEANIASIFQALSQSSKLEIIRLLAARPQGLPGTHIAAILKANPHTTSIQLARLAEVGLTQRTRVGLDVIHHIRPGIGDVLVEYVRNGFKLVRSIPSK